MEGRTSEMSERHHTSVRSPRNENRAMSVTANYQSTVRSIVSAATKCFEEKGIAKTSVSDITRQCGMTRELFYYYFENKEALVAAVVDEYANNFARRLTTWVRHWVNEDSLAVLRRRESMHDLTQIARSLVFSDGDTFSPTMRVLREADAFERMVLEATSMVGGKGHDVASQGLAFIVLGLTGLILSDRDLSVTEIELAIVNLAHGQIG